LPVSFVRQYRVRGALRSVTPAADMCSSRRTPALSAAATTLRGPAALTASNSASLPFRMATRLMIASTPWTAAFSDARSVTSPLTGVTPAGTEDSEPGRASPTVSWPASATAAATSRPM